ncbi:MAG: tRNA (adenosine(37)-N6)-threonylcarbamoyltransferase complex ATPase subunit type 1 TsaE [Nitrospira sp.]|nr:tRNA (adenosine(37)-N6)-threonylcarbamoyltransferase complex ATPase subunit type 1 TsaE [Candidatus Manganitrophaceae bacterium]HIL34516.1 tRNA (adenosine(37)-N6)-threonylcarbamoyltransferase complex ATPase subunit type 1 TsaE [Candidatus Manganitrophaceae bacterium]
MSKHGLKKEETSLTLFSPGEEATFRLGKVFGKTAVGGEIIALIGPLGAGKTLFVRGLAEGLEVRDSHVSSPTYTLLHQHEGRLPLTHVDLYRLNGAHQIETIGLDEYLGGKGVVAVEWADKGFQENQEAHLTITIRFLEGNQREILLTANNAHHKRWLEQIRLSKDWNTIKKIDG